MIPRYAWTKVLKAELVYPVASSYVYRYMIYKIYFLQIKWLKPAKTSKSQSLASIIYSSTNQNMHRLDSAIFLNIDYHFWILSVPLFRYSYLKSYRY